jgi:hypothetical protein
VYRSALLQNEPADFLGRGECNNTRRYGTAPPLTRSLKSTRVCALPVSPSRSRRDQPQTRRLTCLVAVRGLVIRSAHRRPLVLSVEMHTIARASNAIGLKRRARPGAKPTRNGGDCSSAPLITPRRSHVRVLHTRGADLRRLIGARPCSFSRSGVLGPVKARPFGWPLIAASLDRPCARRLTPVLAEPWDSARRCWSSGFRLGVKWPLVTRMLGLPVVMMIARLGFPACEICVEAQARRRSPC